MPSKLKKAIAAMKDHTSIGLARVGGHESSTLEVAILRATTHEDEPVDERHVAGILQMVSSNRSYAACCARGIGRRVGRTRSWMVALKSLMLVLRILEDGDPYFPKEVVQAMRRGYKILNLSSFRDDSGSDSRWDYTGFVRSFAAYLDERLNCFLTGKFGCRRMMYGSSSSHYRRRKETAVKDINPRVLLDRISHWQRLLDRAIATQPTGVAKRNRLVQTCLYAIVQESFELYRDISEGLGLLLDSFFDLQYNNCINAYNTCIKASKQFKDLSFFYDLCKGIGVGRSSEYPNVHKVSDELMNTLHEFLKDFPSGANGRTSSVHLPLATPFSVKESDSDSEQTGSLCMSLEELMNADPRFSLERYSDPGGEKSPRVEDSYGVNDTGSVKSDPVYHLGVSSMLDLLSLENPAPQPERQRQGQENTWESNHGEPSSASVQGWELALFETTSQPSKSDHNHDEVTDHKNGFELDLFKSINSDNNAITPSPWLPSEHSYNPFLQDTVESGFNIAQVVPAGFHVDPTFMADDVANGDLNAIVNLSPDFPTGLNFHAEFSHCDSFLVPAVHSPGGYGTMVAPSTVSADIGGRSGDTTRAIIPFGQVGLDTDQDEQFRLFLGGMHGMTSGSLDIVPFGQVGIDDHFLPSPTFQTTPTFRAVDSEMDRSGPYNGQYNPFGLVPTPEQRVTGGSLAMVPFSQVGTGDPFFPSYNQVGSNGMLSPSPGLQAMPTFRATGLEMNRGGLYNGQDDAFGSFPSRMMPSIEQRMSNGLSFDQQNVLQEQQLWFQNQNKIMARHFTSMHEPSRMRTTQALTFNT